MKSRVFVSCGQHTDKERQIARQLCDVLRNRGFEPYLAIDVQTILDINGGIIRELKNCDCYVLVNFRRDSIGSDKYRGSLFSNQELAIAYALDFEKLLIVNQGGVEPEGMLRYIGINTESFRDHSDCIAVLERAIDRAGWTCDYSRRLSASNLHFSNGVIAYGRWTGWFLYLDIHNNRPDIAAIETTARLAGYSQPGQTFQLPAIRSPLKATGRPGFSQTIFPKSYEAFDLLIIGLDTHANTHANTAAPSGTGSSAVGSEPLSRKSCQVFLNSAFDVEWTCPLPVSNGNWMFRYEFVAVGFPVLSVEVEVEVPSAMSPERPPCAEIRTQKLM